MARLFGFAILITCFWYFFYRSKLPVATVLLLGALWLLFREARQLLTERANAPGRAHRRGRRTSHN